MGKLKKISVAIFALLLSALVLVFILPFILIGESPSRPDIVHLPDLASPWNEEAGIEGPFKVMTLNLAHGRGDRLFPKLSNKEFYESNLKKIAGVIRGEAPALVALQEADGPSFWSGDFDHVRYLARRTGISHALQGEHVNGLGLEYGTALLSRRAFKNPVSITFTASPPSFPKGFVIATLFLKGREITVVSLHLDFLSAGARNDQAETLIETLKQRSGPLIVLGDFNSDWYEEESPLRRIAEKLRLKAYRPDAAHLVTFPATNRRLDWILHSSELKFHSYKVLSDTLSDHRAVVAELVWK
jgi:endonuclease/exonuclease/phosphatase family metal-dependent hydrolase